MDKIDKLIFKAVSVIAEYYETTTDKILGDDYCPERSLAMKLSVDLVGEIIPKGAIKRVSDFFGRNHATVSLNCKKMTKSLEKKDSLRFKYGIFKLTVLEETEKTVISGQKAERKLSEIARIPDDNALAESLRNFLSTYNLKPLLWNS